jgi:hypothetical protein
MPGKHIVRDGIVFIDGEHDGYTVLPQPVTHRRRRFTSVEPLIAPDELTGRGEHEFQFLHTLHPPPN